MKKIFFLFVAIVIICAFAAPHAFASTYKFGAQWGSLGTGDGQFDSPQGVAVDSSGNVYVADTNNDRVQKFDSNGNYSAQWGSMGTGDGQFDSPQGVAVDSSGNVYVADTNNDRVQKFDSNGNYSAQWGSMGTGDGQFDSPQGVAVDSSGNVYVADTNNDRVQKFDSNSSTWRSIEGFNYPQGMVVDSSGNVYVADTNNNRIQEFNSSGSLLTTLGSAGSGNGQFASPQGVAVDTVGAVYVADTGNNLIQKFTAYGFFSTQWGSSGQGEGQFASPQGVAVDASGNNVYVADTNNNRILKFSLFYKITAYAGSGGKILCTYEDDSTDPKGFIEVPSEKSVTCSITPDKNYGIVSVTGCGGHLSDTTYTIDPVEADCTVSATFIKTFLVTPSADANGSIDPSSPQTVNSNATAPFTVTPNTGYHIDTVSGCGEGTLSGNTYTTGPVMGDCTVTATFAINTYNITAYNYPEGNGSVTPDGVTVVDYGKNCTFSITPNMKYHVVDVVVDGNSAGAVGSYPFNNVTADHTITASFAINTYNIVVTKSGTGKGKITSQHSGKGNMTSQQEIECGDICSAAYEQETTVTLTPVPDAGSVFAGWKGGCKGAGACVMTLYANKSVVAMFTAVQAGDPRISVKPASINFGPLKAGGTSGAKAVTVRNTGKGSLIINSITFAGADAEDFSQIDFCTVISPGDSCTIDVSFASTSTFGKKSADLTISSNDPRHPVVKVKLSGRTGPPKIAIYPRSVDFGSVQSGNASPSKVITIRNAGISDLVVHNVTVMGTNAGEFSRANPCSTIPKGGSCTVYATFMPALPAAKKNATLHISSNDPKNSNIDVKLSGVGK